MHAYIPQVYILVLKFFPENPDKIDHPCAPAPDAFLESDGVLLQIPVKAGPRLPGVCVFCFLLYIIACCIQLRLRLMQAVSAATQRQRLPDERTSVGSGLTACRSGAEAGRSPHRSD